MSLIAEFDISVVMKPDLVVVNKIYNELIK